MSINHISTNLVTKGLLNMSNITKGMLIISGYEIVYKRKGGGGGNVVLPYGREEQLYQKVKENYDEIDYIKVYVDWKKKYKGSKIIEAQIIKDHIEAKILLETKKEIKVQLIEL